MSKETTPLLSTSSIRESSSSGGGVIGVQQFRREQYQRHGSHRDSSSLAQSFRQVVDATFAVAAHDDDYKTVSLRDFGGQATMASEMATISKNLIGGGVLSLSGGIALAANAPTAVLPASLVLLLLAAVFGYYCWLIGKLCKYTGQVTFRELWHDTVGTSVGTWAVPLVNAGKAALGTLAYSAILSQTGVSLSQSLGYAELSRVASLLVITVTLILPLCLLKHLNVLAPLSVLGTLSIVLTAGAMAVRYWDGSYKAGGQYYSDLDEQYVPAFGTNAAGAWGLPLLPFCCMAFEAYVMHYNAARLYAELKRATLPRFATVVSVSFGFTAAVYIAIAALGYLTFGANASSYILNNYSPHDPLATASRLLVAFSTLTTYPIVFMGLRDGVLELLDLVPEQQTEWNLNVVSIVLLTALTITAVFVTDLGMINAVGGGTLATIMVFVFPTLMYRSIVEHLDLGTAQEKPWVRFTSALAVLGVVLGVVGVYLSLLRGE